MPFGGAGRAGALWLLGAVAGCGAAREPAAAAPAWVIESKPLLVIASAAGNPSVELHRVTGAVRLGGGLAVANSGVSEVLFFDAGGRLRARAGRKGQGPGEFEGSLHLFQVSPDTVAVFDNGLDRWSFFTTSGVLGRSGSGADIGEPARTGLTTLTADALVRDRRFPGRPKLVERLLSGVAGVESAARFHVGLVDDRGVLWLRPVGEPSRWSVRDRAGRETEVVFPRGAELLDAADSVVVVGERDSVDLERVAVYRVSRPESALRPAPARTPPAVATGSAAAIDALHAQLPKLLMAQEINYGKHGTYAGVADSLDWKPEGGRRLYLLTGTARSWFGVLTDPSTGAACGVGVGDARPAGWLDGVIVCGASGEDARVRRD